MSQLHQSSTEKTVRNDRQQVVKILAFGVVLGGGIALLKGDVAGVRGAAGNLVGPWLLPAFYSVLTLTHRRTMLTAAWLASALAVASFYFLQWARWDLVNGHTAAYNLFWVVAGATACAVVALIASYIARTPSMLWLLWGQSRRCFQRSTRSTC